MHKYFYGQCDIVQNSNMGLLKKYRHCTVGAALFCPYGYRKFDVQAVEVGVKMVDTQKTTPSGYACHPSTGGEWSDTVNRTDTIQPPRQAMPATPLERRGIIW